MKRMLLDLIEMFVICLIVVPLSIHFNLSKFIVLAMILILVFIGEAIMKKVFLNNANK